MQAVILAGGLGTRLKDVLPPDTPKALAPIGDRKFIDFQINYLFDQGIKDIVICLGHLADKIRNYLGDGSPYGVNIKYSLEVEPLGTGGAIKNALSYLDNYFCILNGDSFLNMNIAELAHFHHKNNASLTLALTTVHNASRYGMVDIEDNGKILSFKEKDQYTLTGVINAGVYIVNRDAIPWHNLPKCFSLEKDLFPAITKQGRLFGYKVNGFFIDIGIPTDYSRFIQFTRGIKP